MLGNIKEFSFAEMFSNDSGRTSITKFAGFYIIMIGGFCFFLGCIDIMFLDKTVDIITESTVFTGIGAGLLGVKNIVNGQKTNVTNNGHNGE